MKDPGQPTAEEVAEHNIDHTPYRAWCPSCVKARGIGTPHRRRRDEQEVPVFGFDYLSATEAEGEVKILVAHCQYTKCVFAHVVPQKGVDAERYAVER